MTERRLPDFVVIGGRKCGTTWLDGLLRQHPQLHLPTETKELFFFDRYWDRGVDWYEDQFGAPPADALVGEVTPSYLHGPEVPERLSRVLPDARLIVLLRDPVSRAWSDYLHARRKGDVHGALPEAIRSIPSIVDESRYSEALERWTERFGDQVLVLYFDSLTEDPSSTLERLLNHLGAQPFDEWTIDEENANRSREPRSAFASGVAHRASRAAHRAGLHRLVDVAKRAGVDEILERTGTASAAVEDRTMLHELLDDDLEPLAHLLPEEGRPPWLTKSA